MKIPLTILVSVLLLTASSGAARADVNINDIEAAVISEDYVRAESLCEELIAKFPQSSQVSEARYYLGLSALRLNQFDKARTVFEGLTAELPRGTLSDKAYLGLIDVENLSERYEAALARAGKFLSLNPPASAVSLVYLKMARSHLKLAHWDEARNSLSKIIEQFPGSPEAISARQLLEEEQYYTVQVGAFLNRSRADRLSQELRDKGEYAFIVETTDANQSVFYRVRVGKFSRLSDAKTLKQKMSRQGYPTYIYP